jgi:hypothetical protein
MGVNALRTSHDPPDPAVIDGCEELGVVLLVEAFDCWRTGKHRWDYGRFFDEWCGTPVRPGARSGSADWRPRPPDRPPATATLPRYRPAAVLTWGYLRVSTRAVPWRHASLERGVQ